MIIDCTKSLNALEVPNKPSYPIIDEWEDRQNAHAEWRGYVTAKMEWLQSKHKLSKREKKVTIIRAALQDEHWRDVLSKHGSNIAHCVEDYRILITDLAFAAEEIVRIDHEAFKKEDGEKQ